MPTPMIDSFAFYKSTEMTTAESLIVYKWFVKRTKEYNINRKPASSLNSSITKITYSPSKSIYFNVNCRYQCGESGYTYSSLIKIEKDTIKEIFNDLATYDYEAESQNKRIEAFCNYPKENTIAFLLVTVYYEEHAINIYLFNPNTDKIEFLQGINPF